jgi:hypothetical protein
MDRLNFKLDEFMRYSWVSEQARSVWEPRISHLSNFFITLEREAVLHRVKPAVLTNYHPAELARNTAEWAKQGLLTAPLYQENLSGTYVSATQKFDPKRPWMYKVAIGDPEVLSELISAHAKGDWVTVGKCLGYPKCCIMFFLQYWVQQGWFDTTYPMSKDWRGGFVHPANNILLRWAGIRLASHLPCSFHCKHTEKQGMDYIRLAERIGYKEEIAQVVEMLNWPVEWSSLHGVAIITTPVFRIVTATDALPEKVYVRIMGDRYPAEGASSDTFPFGENSWSANGFRTKEAMSQAHADIINAVKPLFPRSIVDFGCGNSWLLYTLKRLFLSDIYGIDTDPAKNPNWVGDIFDYNFHRDFDVALISQQRINERPEQWEKLREGIFSHCKYLVIYDYSHVPTHVTITRTGHDVTTEAVPIC